VLIAPHPRTRATSRSSSPNRVCHSYSLVKQHVFLRSCGAVLRPGFVSFASRTRIEGWRSAERRTDACEASGGPALTGQARHLARRLASPTGDARLPALHRGDFGLRSRASFTSICAGSVQRAPRSQVVVPGGRGPGPAGTAVMSRRRGTPRLAPPQRRPRNRIGQPTGKLPLGQPARKNCLLANDRVGTKRRFVVMRRTVAIGGIADINGHTALPNSIESDLGHLSYFPGSPRPPWEASRLAV
jgi:hypothetical protein